MIGQNRIVRDSTRPNARPGLGVSSAAGGRDYYRYAVRHYTTTDRTPDEIHAIGLAEVARIRAEMETTMREAGFTGTYPEFLAFLRSDPRFYAQSRDVSSARSVDRAPTRVYLHSERRFGERGGPPRSSCRSLLASRPGTRMSHAMRPRRARPRGGAWPG